MNKFLCIVVAVAMFAVPSRAQDKTPAAGDLDFVRPSRPLYAGLQGGVLYSLNENTFSFGTHRITGFGGVQFGFFFANQWSVRASVSYGLNAGACNSYQTNYGYYPYTFKSINAFLDVVFDCLSRGDDSPLRGFYPRLYAGLGYGHTFGFSDSGHPWQKVSPVNNEFGFRLGAIGEFTISRRVALFLDLCAEAYGDQYNGLQPSTEDQQYYKGYAGFPMDLRFVASLGVFFRF